MVISMTPFRVSFFGGGSDYPSWFREHGGTVISSTINKYCFITCRYLPPFFDHSHRIVYGKVEVVKSISEIQHPSVQAVLQWLKVEQGLEIHHDGDLPARSGLGSSSAFTVGLLNAISALHGKHISNQKLASQAIHIEQNVIKENVGSQDQIATACGGFNVIKFEANGDFDVSPVILTPEKRANLEGHLMLFFTGISRNRNASDIAKSQIANISSKKRELYRMMNMVGDAKNILQDSTDYCKEFGQLLDESWRLKRSLSDKVSTKEIDDMYEAAKNAGAYGGKLMGAGGGGFLILIVKPELQKRVSERLKNLIHVPIKFEFSGSKIVFYQPDGFA
jgi:D-glycero-alpha-D-manno-heptose-7-phosphate kinase